MLWCLRRASFVMNLQCFHRNFSAFQSLVPLQLPSKSETHFWYILPDEVKSASLLDRYLEILSPCEKEKVFQMRGDELRKGATLARALVRTTIARYQVNSMITPKSLKFRKNLHGKPEVDWEHDDDSCPMLLNFNISHTSSLIACGVTLGSPIGIDVEEKQRTLKNNILSFARRYFSVHELETLSTISAPEVQRHEFLKLWTLKEAYVKALGRGFSAAPFNTFTIRLRSGTNGGGFLVNEDPSSKASEIIVESMDDPGNLKSDWQFKLFELGGAHFAAICTQNDSNNAGQENIPKKLSVWKTIPFVEDVLVSGTDAIKEII